MKIINKPNRIFLNTGIPSLCDNIDWNDPNLMKDEITWCEEQICKSDISYYSEEIILEILEDFNENLGFPTDSSNIKEYLNQLLKKLGK